MKNFQINEKIKIVSTSCNEVLMQEHDLSTENLSIIFEPAVIGIRGGVAKLEIMRSDETLCIEVPWGINQTAPRSEYEPYSEGLSMAMFPECDPVSNFLPLKN